MLILGSLPGDVSLARGEYYARPRNQFWRLMGRVLGADPPDRYAARLAVLTEAGVGLWDVLRTARRAGSLDGAIRDPSPNPLADFAASLPHLRAIAFNGRAAATIGTRMLAKTDALTLICLPSSSPAHTMAFERKAAAWLVLRRHVDPRPG